MRKWLKRQKRLSVIVVVHNMAREAPRTLYSLSTDYQRDIVADDYEVLVVDNGSQPPLDDSALQKLAGNFRYITGLIKRKCVALVFMSHHPYQWQRQIAYYAI